MTDEKARLILSKSEAWIDWDDDRRKPLWDEATIGLNGYFTAAQLMAILHFGPSESTIADHADVQTAKSGGRRPN